MNIKHCLLILFIFANKNLYSHKIVLVTEAEERVSIDSELLTVDEIQSPGFAFLACDTIKCPTIFKKTLERVARLLDYRKETEYEEILIFFNTRYASFSAKEAADLLNTFDFLKLETFLDLALANCPLNKETDIFSLCCDSLQKKIQLFNSYLRIKILFNDGAVIKYIDVPFNVACLLPGLKEKHTFLKNVNETYQKPIEVELPEDCVPYYLSLTDQEKFFNVFFKIVKDFNAYGQYDFGDVKNVLFQFGRKYSTTAIFCNLLNFFKLYSLLKSFVTNNQIHLNDYFSRLNSATQTVLGNSSNDETNIENHPIIGFMFGTIVTVAFVAGIEKMFGK